MIDRIRRIVGRHTEVPEPGQPLKLESVILVAIAEDVESELGIRIRPAELAPENFGSVEALAAFADRKRA
jgi:acyl carrier protein